MRPTFSTVLAIVLLGPGCAATEDRYEIPISRFDDAIARYSINSGIHQKKLLVSLDERQWQKAWSALHASRRPPPDLPSVDFSKQMTVIYAIGDKPSGGYSVKIVRAAVSGDSLRVTVRIESPSSRCIVSSSITAPADAVMMPRTERPVIIEEVLTTAAC